MIDDALASINWLAVIVVVLAGFAVGSLWYGALFGKAWMREIGLTEEKARAANMVRLYGSVVVLNIVAAVGMSGFIIAGDAAYGAFIGFIVGFAFVATALGVVYLFEGRSLRLWLINAGYQVVFFTIMGTILGAWH